MHREVEAASQVFEVLNGFKALYGIFCHRVVARRHEVGVGLMVAAPDAASQLMQLRESKHVRAVDEDGVGVGDVNARLDDGGAKEHVEALLVEVAHDVLQLPFAHLPVRHGDAGFGQELFQPLLARFNGAHFVMKEVDLAAALQFADHGFADEFVGLPAHEGFDRKALLRRRRNDGEVADAFQAHRERAGDRGGGKREHVHLGAQGLQLFLLPHAKAVLFVDHDQSEARKRNLFT